MSANELIIKAFIEEASELLNSMEGYILDLEKDSKNMEILAALFRSIHTIKSSAGMAGFNTIYRFAHRIEDPFDMIRNGKKEFTPEVADLTLRARDIISNLLFNGEDLSVSLKKEMDSIVERLGGKEDPENLKLVAESQPTQKVVKTRENCYRISFIPNEDLFIRGGDPFKIFDELKAIGHVTITTSFDTVPLLTELDPLRCYSSWEIVISTGADEGKLKNAFLFFLDGAHFDIKQIENCTGEEVPMLGEILADRGDISENKLKDILDSRPKIGEMLVDQKIVSPSTIDAALKEQQHLKMQKTRTENAVSSIRVGTDKLDKLVDLVGELVTIQAQLSQSAYQIKDPELDSISENLQRLIEELRDSALGIRMIPVESSFSSFRRLVRDLSADLGKQVDFRLVGGETELDKTVIERIQDPLTHMIRNCIDHGLELPQVRRNAGKPDMGTIVLRARHSGGNVIVSVEDDGAGIDRVRVKEKAVEQGLITADQKLSDNDLYALLFRSGFSTAKAVSQVSGRGVGMDVVKKEIDSLGGSISIESEEGKFTRISFTLPLTLAIIDGLMVRVGEDRYIIPLSSVESCIERSGAAEQKKKSKDGKMGSIIQYRGNFIPYIELRPFFKMERTEGLREQIVIVRTDTNQNFGIVVDQVIGDHQTVIKSMGKAFKDAKAFSGATILGDGTIALILNVSVLTKIVEEINGADGSK